MMIDSAELDAFENLLKDPAPAPEEKPAEKPEDTEVEEVETEEDADADDETPDEDEKPQPKKEKPRAQERINELTARARQAERVAEAAQRELAEIKAAKEKPAEQPATLVGEPDPDAKNPDGSDKYPLGEVDKAYLRDLARYYTQEERAAALAEQERTADENATNAARDQLQAHWEEKLAPVTEEIPDFVEKTMELESTFEGLDPEYSDYLVQTIKSLENGPQVLYHFANNIAEAQKFVKLGVLSATLALGKYDAMFSEKQKGKPEPRTTKAPPPPVVNKGAAKPAKDWEDADLDDFYRKLHAKK